MNPVAILVGLVAGLVAVVSLMRGASSSGSSTATPPTPAPSPAPAPAPVVYQTAAPRPEAKLNGGPDLAVAAVQSIPGVLQGVAGIAAAFGVDRPTAPAFQWGAESAPWPAYDLESPAPLASFQSSDFSWF